MIRREDVTKGVYLLHGVMSPKECKRAVAAAEAIGFTHAGLAIGNDTYRVNLAVRNNVRVVLDAPRLAAALWERVRGHVDSYHEAASIKGLNARFRVYRYDQGQRFFPHVDVRTTLPRGETRASLMIYLNDGFEGGETRFFEEKDKKSRRGAGRGRKFNNRVRFARRPAPGGVVVFDHLLLHEGSEVTAGVKCAVRSDHLCTITRGRPMSGGQSSGRAPGLWAARQTHDGSYSVALAVIFRCHPPQSSKRGSSGNAH